MCFLCLKNYINSIHQHWILIQFQSNLIETEYIEIDYTIHRTFTIEFMIKYMFNKYN